jgi:hypothetical protein
MKVVIKSIPSLCDKNKQVVNENMPLPGLLQLEEGSSKLLRKDSTYLRVNKA